MYPNDSADYAQGRLVNTIVRHQGKAVIVDAVRFVSADKPLNVVAHQILDGKKISDKIDNFDLSPVPLGFVNSVGDVGYLARTPIRRDWRQGLRRENATWLWHQLLWSYEEIANTIEGNYASLDDALKLAPNRGLVAWNREFAVDDKHNIYHRFYDKVGNFIEGTKNFLLDPRFLWVEQNLKAAIK